MRSIGRPGDHLPGVRADARPSAGPGHRGLRARRRHLPLHGRREELCAAAHPGLHGGRLQPAHSGEREGEQENFSVLSEGAKEKGKPLGRG